MVHGADGDAPRRRVGQAEHIDPRSRPVLRRGVAEPVPRFCREAKPHDLAQDPRRGLVSLLGERDVGEPAYRVLGGYRPAGPPRPARGIGHPHDLEPEAVRIVEREHVLAEDLAALGRHAVALEMLTPVAER